jgi:hypothetical protein
VAGSAGNDAVITIGIEMKLLGGHVLTTVLLAAALAVAAVLLFASRIGHQALTPFVETMF